VFRRIAARYIPARFIAALGAAVIAFTALISAAAAGPH
jgi:hypothetical protein